MKINAIKQFSGIHPHNFLNKQVLNYSCNNLYKDVFVKNISFCGERKFNNLYNNYKNDISSYILNSDNINIEGVETILQKYSPTTKVDDMKNLTSVPHPYSEAYNSLHLDFMSNGGKIFVVEKPRTIYLPFEASLKKRDRLNLLKFSLHEGVHVFQNISDDKLSTREFLSKYVNNENKKEKALLNISLMPKIYKLAEQELMNETSIVSSLNNPLSPENINKPFSMLYKETTNQDFKDRVSQVLDGIFGILKNQAENIDEKTICKYISLIADNEKEANELTLKEMKKVTDDKQLQKVLELNILIFDNLKKEAARK